MGNCPLITVYFSIIYLMVNKKQPAAEKASKNSKPVSSVKKENNQLSPKAQELFAGYYQDPKT